MNEAAVQRSLSADRIAVHHYATKSWEDFAAAEGAAVGPGEEPHTPAYFAAINQEAVDDCMQAVELGWR